MVINLPKSIQEAIKKSPLIIGVGPSAWPRVISGYYFPKFKILCFHDCQDNELIKETGISVYSQEQIDPKFELVPLTPGNMISTDIAKKFLDGLGEDFTFLVYKSMGKLERVCRENGWKFLGNKMDIKDKYENKKIFKEILPAIGIEPIPGENIPISQLTEDKIAYYQNKLGTKSLVLQIAEATWGGGSGTFFIQDKSDLKKFRQRVEEIKGALESKKKKMKTVNIAPFIEGISCSIPCCATKHGTFTGSIQTQIVDVEEVGANLPTRSGVFAGHDWGFRHFSETEQKQATEMGRKFGEYLYKKGYKGIFGLDLIIDKNGKIWPVECNPRETDAFPLICMLQMESGAVPMQVFHNLEHLGIPYEINFEEVDGSYKKKYSASQVLLYNKSDRYVIDRKALKAGIYKLEKGELKFVRPGFASWDLTSGDEYLITEDIAKNPGTIYDPHERMLRLIKKGNILETENKLKKESADMVEAVYKELKLVPIENGLVDKRGLNILFIKKLLDIGKSKDFARADVVNVVKNTGSGFYRPISVAWRKSIDPGIPAISQVPSKRARKQIKSDTKKIEEIGIEIKVIDKISQNDFDKWHDLYKKVIGRMGKGEVMIEKDWLTKKEEKGKKVGAILAFKDGNVIGGDIFSEVNGVLGAGYGVAERIEGLSGGLTLLIDYNFLEYARGLGYKEVSFGQDTNLYGYDLSAGLIDYKQKLGFHPVPANKTYWVSTYFRSFEKFEGEVKFFSEIEEKLAPVTILKTNRDNILKNDKTVLSIV